MSLAEFKSAVLEFDAEYPEVMQRFHRVNGDAKKVAVAVAGAARMDAAAAEGEAE